MGDPWSRSWPAPETHWHCCHEGWHHHQHWHHQRFLCNQWQDLLFINTLQGHSITISWRLKMCQKILTKIMKDGNIAVSDYDNKWISVHEPNGKFVSKVSFYHNFIDQKIWSILIMFPKVGRKQAAGPKGCCRCRLWRNHCHRQQGQRSVHPTSCLGKGGSWINTFTFESETCSHI